MANEKILLIDDDRALTKAVAIALRKEQMQVDTADCGMTAMERIGQASYDAILLDLQMPDQDGFELIQKFRSNKIYTPIIIISGREEEHNKILALGLGADDYLTKPFSIHLLCSKVKAMIRRSSMYQQESAQKVVAGPFCLDKDKMEFTKDSIPLSLTSKEIKLFHLFIEHPNRVYTKEQLYEMVWNDTAVDDNTIMVYIKRLRAKIEDEPKNPKYLLTVWGIGYQFKI